MKYIKAIKKAIKTIFINMTACTVIALIIAKLCNFSIIADKAYELCRLVYEKRKAFAIAILIIYPGIFANVLYMAAVYSMKDILRDAYNRQVVYTV